jgi:hypothetical protein
MTNSLCPLLDEYLRLVDDTEAPILYHRWCFITAVAGMLHRRTRYKMATGDIYPNMFTILLGPPGARKSTAINMVAEIVRESGYRNICSGKTSPEQFLMDLRIGFDTIRIDPTDIDVLTGRSVQDILDRPSSHVLIKAGELQDFLGSSNINFISQLTNLWDNPPDYPYRLKNGTQELIKYPTISLIGGATQSTFKRMFPLDVVGQGLLSRFILIHGAGARKKIFEPKPLDTTLKEEITSILKILNSSEDIPKEYTLTAKAKEFSKVLYESCEAEITDPRFQHYANRRNDHYMKLAMCIAAMNLHTEIEEEDCVYANTILTYTEKFMPTALGEFGLDHNADQTEYLHSLILKHPTGISIPDLVNKGLSVFKSTSELAQHLMRLKNAKRVDQISINGHIKYIPLERTVATESRMVNFQLLKEYIENPTFNTAHIGTERGDTEWELDQALTQKPTNPRGLII